MNRALVLCLTWIPWVAWADVDARFAALRDAAEPVGGLSHFLEKYIGDCGGKDAHECKHNAKSFRQKMKGKKLYMIITEESATMLSPGGYDPSTGDFVIHITPFFSAGGYALSQGAPKRTDGNGNPILPFLRAHGEAIEGWSASRFQRLFSMRELRLQVVFTPEDVWTLRRRGAENVQGVRAKIDGILVSVGRTGEQAALWLARSRN